MPDFLMHPEEHYHIEKGKKKMKYKVGDKVRVKKDLKLCQGYYMENKKGGVNTFVPPMTDYRGQLVTISKIINGQYCVKECPYGTNHKPVLWTDGMFESSDEKIVIIASGMKTIAKLYNGDKIAKTAIARCSPEDTFDFAEGARLAFSRLLEERETELVKPRIEVGKYYKHVGESDDDTGIIKIRHCDASEHNIVYYYDIIEGMKLDDMGFYFFDAESPFAHKLTLIDYKPKLMYYNGKVVCTYNGADADGFTVGKIYEFVNGTVVDDDGDVRYKFCPLYSISNLKITKFIPLIENRKEKK